jgi:integrase
VAGQRRLAALFQLALGSGMRQGEILALAWDAIDFDRGTVAVRRTLVQDKAQFVIKEPKSKNSRRTVRLPPFVLSAPHEHRKAMVREGNGAAPVFCTKTGNYLGKSNLIRQVFKPILRQANDRIRSEAEQNGTEPTPLPDVRFHDLRHTHASLLLLAGESLKAVSQRLGHSNVELTLRVSCHVLPDADNALADRAERLFA